MKATTLLQRQHRNLQQLCETVERGSVNIRESLLPQLAGDLVAHMAVEGQIFFPAVSLALRDKTWERAGRARHAEARHAMDRALEAELDGEPFTLAIRELQKLLELHAVEEEQLLFPRVERAIPDPGLRELAHRMMTFHHAKLDAGYPASRAPALPALVPDAAIRT